MDYTLDIVNVHGFFSNLKKDIDEETRIASVGYEKLNGELATRLNIEYLERQKWHACWFFLTCDSAPFLRIVHTFSTGRSAFLHRTISECLLKHTVKRRPFGQLYAYRSNDKVCLACNYALAIYDDWLDPEVQGMTMNLLFNTFAAMHADVQHAVAALTV